MIGEPTVCRRLPLHRSDRSAVVVATTARPPRTTTRSAEPTRIRSSFRSEEQASEAGAAAVSEVVPCRSVLAPPTETPPARR